MDRVFFYDESVSSKEELHSVELSRKLEIGLGMPCRDTNKITFAFDSLWRLRTIRPLVMFSDFSVKTPFDSASA